MVTTVKSNWVSSLNNSLGSTSQTDSYQRLLLGIKNLFLDASWTVQLCSNGVTTSTTDLWGSTPGNIVWGTTGARSWIALGAPANFAGNTTYSILIEAYNIPSPTIPNAYRIYSSPTAFIGGNTTTLPTGGAGSSTPRTFATPYLTTGDIPEQVYLNTWRNASGDVYWIAKRQSAMTYARFGAVVDADNARTNTARLLILHDSDAPFYNPSVYGHATDNSAVTTCAATTRASSVGSWPSGVDSTNNVGYFPIFVVNNGNTSLTARDYGVLDDLWAVATSTPDNATDATDSDLVRLLTIGSIAIPTTFAQVPIL